jgi:preprotein translocase subunit YajC
MYSLIAMAPPQGSGGSPEGSLVSTLVMFGLIIGIFYFMILRPQQKRQKEREKLLTTMKKGDKIITAGGLHGTISGIDEKTVLIQVADTVKLKYDRSAIASIVREGESETKDAKESK